MTKRKVVGIDEYMLIVSLIVKNDLAEFVAYVTRPFLDTTLDIFDLSRLPVTCQVPFIFPACKHSNAIAIYLIKEMDADVKSVFQGRTVLGSALRNKNFEISLELTDLIMEKMWRERLPIPLPVINFLDSRRLLDPQDLCLKYLSEAFDVHNSALDIYLQSAMQRSLTDSSTNKRQRVSSDAASSGSATTFYDTEIEERDTFQTLALKFIANDIAHTMHAVTVELSNNQSSAWVAALSALDAHVRAFQETCGDDLDLLKLYAKYMECFPKDFPLVMVKLLRKADALNFLPSEPQNLRRDLNVLREMLGANTTHRYSPARLSPA